MYYSENIIMKLAHIMYLFSVCKATITSSDSLSQCIRELMSLIPYFVTQVANLQDQKKSELSENIKKTSELIHSLLQRSSDYRGI